jgi:hypothetical protein
MKKISNALSPGHDLLCLQLTSKGINICEDQRSKKVAFNDLLSIGVLGTGPSILYITFDLILTIVLKGRGIICIYIHTQERQITASRSHSKLAEKQSKLRSSSL